jgi:hypothetical protein
VIPFLAGVSIGVFGFIAGNLGLVMFGGTLAVIAFIHLSGFDRFLFRMSEIFDERKINPKRLSW